MVKPDTDLTEDELDQVDEAGDAIQEGIEESGGRFITFARAYITGFILLIVGSLIGAISVGIIQPEVIVTGTTDIGWIVEYMVMFLAAVVALWTASMFLIALPGSFISGLISAVARIADAYEMPSNNDE